MPATDRLQNPAATMKMMTTIPMMMAKKKTTKRTLAMAVPARAPKAKATPQAGAAPVAAPAAEAAAAALPARLASGNSPKPLQSSITREH